MNEQDLSEKLYNYGALNGTIPIDMGDDTIERLLADMPKLIKPAQYLELGDVRVVYQDIYVNRGSVGKVRAYHTTQVLGIELEREEDGILIGEEISETRKTVIRGMLYSLGCVHVSFPDITRKIAYELQKVHEVHRLKESFGKELPSFDD